TGFGLGFALERLLVADMDMRVENAGQNHAPTRIVDLGGGLRQAPAYDRDLAASNADVGLHLANTGDHQGAAADDEIELCHHGNNCCVILERATSRPSLNTCKRGGCSRSASCSEGAPTTTKSARLPGAMP